MRTLTLILVSLLGLTACNTFSPSHRYNHAHPSGTALSTSADSEQVATYGMSNDDGGLIREKKCRPTPMRGGLTQRYFFEFDSDAIKPQYKQALQNQIAYLKLHTNTRVHIEGNTDDRGSREYNIGLGWRRTRAVMHQLKAAGIPKSRIVPVSFGAEKPVTFGQTEADYRCNRRVDLWFEG